MRKKLFLAGALLLAGCDQPTCKYQVNQIVRILPTGETAKIIDMAARNKFKYCQYTVTLGMQPDGTWIHIHNLNEYMLGDMNENSNQAKPFR